MACKSNWGKQGSAPRWWPGRGPAEGDAQVPWSSSARGRNSRTPARVYGRDPPEQLARGTSSPFARSVQRQPVRQAKCLALTAQQLAQLRRQSGNRGPAPTLLAPKCPGTAAPSRGTRLPKSCIRNSTRPLREPQDTDRVLAKAPGGGSSPSPGNSPKFLRQLRSSC